MVKAFIEKNINLIEYWVNKCVLLIGCQLFFNNKCEDFWFGKNIQLSLINVHSDISNFLMKMKKILCQINACIVTSGIHL